MQATTNGTTTDGDVNNVSWILPLRDRDRDLDGAKQDAAVSIRDTQL